jgi:hypothetical protein
MLLSEIATQPQFAKPDFSKLYDAAQVYERFRGMPVEDFVNQCRLGKAVYFSKLKDLIVKPTYEDFQSQQMQQPQQAAPRTMPVLIEIGDKVGVLSGGDTITQCIRSHIDPICWLVRS